MSVYDPYKKYTSSTDISSSFIIDDWKCELVAPKHPAMSSLASINPFGSDIDWVDREKQMIKLMRGRMGVGLSSPQIGNSYNMFVMTHSVLGNIGIYKPEILEYSEETISIEEGCLSFPKEVRVRYTKNNGETIVQTWMDGMDARCFQHEFEHLQGVLFIDEVSDFKLRRAKEKRDKLFKKFNRRMQ